MCGIFGHFGKTPPDESILIDIAIKADERGGHSFGMAFGKPRWLACMTQPYRFTDDVAILPCILATTPCVVFGHSRLATSGDPDYRKEDCQPLFHNMYYIAHNGNFPNPELTFQKYGHKPESRIDSEALLVEYIHQGASFLEGLKLPHALVIYNEDENMAILSNNELPLYLRIVGESLYFCSKPFDGAEPLNGIHKWHG